MRSRWLLALGLVAGVLAAAQARGAGFDDFEGHLSFGYAKLFAEDAPGGSLSVSGGMDYPVATALRLGVALGFHLLGSRAVERGSLIANVDYSLLEVAALAHWRPDRLAPIERISVGPALLSARAELSTSGGGAAFGDLAVEEVAPGLALDVTVMRRSPTPVRVGFEAGTRVAFLDAQRWTLATARLAFHY